MKRISEGGSALVYILIGVALFAALSYAVSNMMRGGNASTITTEKASVLASDILDYSAKMRSAVQMMKISNGCTDTQINFNNPVVSDYINPNSPNDGICDVFSPSGAGMNWQNPPDEAVDPGVSSPNYGGLYTYTGYDCIPEVGTGEASDCWTNGTDTDTELTMQALGLKKEVCESINKRLDINTMYTQSATLGNGVDQTIARTRFKGKYGVPVGATSGHIVLWGGEGFMAACFYDAGTSAYIFYQVLIAR